jgi:hypothetical protein
VVDVRTTVYGSGNRIRLELSKELNEYGVGGRVDLMSQSGEHVPAPLLVIVDPGCDSLRMQAYPQNVQRRLYQMGGDARHQFEDGAVGGYEAPVPVDRQCGVRLVTGQHQVNRLAYLLEGWVIEPAL